MSLRSVGCVAAAICVSAIGPRSAPAQGDPFVQQRELDAAPNAGAGFSIAFADARRSFRPGESIPIVLSFRDVLVSPHNYEHCHGLGLAEVVLDQSEGTADPQADLWNNGVTRNVCGVLSGVMGRLPGSTGPHVIEVPVYLNQAVRFDRPGAYRFYVRSRHGSVFSRKEPTLISNILELEIKPRDPDWEETTLAEALAALDRSNTRATRLKGARTISYLGSRAAVDEMARAFDRRSPFEDAGPEANERDAHWVRGLYGSPERGYVVARMEQELDRADRRISSVFVTHLSVLDLSRRSQTRPLRRSDHDARVKVYSTRHLAALKAAGTLRAVLAQAFSFATQPLRRLRFYALPSGFASVADDVEAALLTLPGDQQQTFLAAERNWTAFRDPAFIPMLQRLAAAADRSGPQDMVLRLLYDLAPDVGRRIALQALGATDSHLTVRGLSVLPDALLPRFDSRFISTLENARDPDDYLEAMGLIERFGTGRIARRVRRVYERFKGARSCRLAPPALAYFFRVDPVYAREEIANVMREVYEGERCDGGVLPALAERRPHAAMEEVAIRHLEHENGWIVADAAEMLMQHGSARAEAALWGALERWHNRWKDHASTVEAHYEDSDGMPWKVALEGRLSEALMGGTAWLMSETSAHRLSDLCVSQTCRDSIQHAFQNPAPIPVIRISPSPVPLGEPSFFVHANTFVRLSPRAALFRWLALHPEGSSFIWQDHGWFDDETWLPGEANGFFEETRAFLEQRGMSLTRRWI